MIRGTSTQFKFKLPYTKGELMWATIKFWQSNNLNDRLPITKRLEHCGGSDDLPELCVALTADETAIFSDKYKAKVQIRAQHISGTVFGCRPRLITVYPMIDDIFEDDTIMPGVSEEGWIILDGETIVEEDS